MPDTPTQIEETVSVKASKLKTGLTLPGGSPKKRKLTADPAQEYVSGGHELWALQYLRSLSFAVDDITADFGDDLYERMLLDGCVASNVHLLKMAILADGLQVLPAVKEFMGQDPKTGARKPHPEWNRAKEIADFVSRQLSDLRAAFNLESASTLYWAIYDLLDAIAFGNRIAEVLLEECNEGEDAGKWCLKGLKCKPRRNAAFIVDAFNNILGIAAIIPDQALNWIQQGYVTDPNQIPNLLPRKKFAVMTFRPRNSDPRGQSLLRPAYDPWFVKGQIKQERLKYLAQFAVPSLIGFTAPDAEAVQEVDAEGNLVYDDNDLPVRINPEQAMMTALQAFQNGSVSAFPAGAKVDVLKVGEQSPFEDALKRQNGEITEAILGQRRMTQEAKHGSRADSETAQDVFGIVVRHGKSALKTTLERDVIAALVEFNYGRKALALCPTLSLGETEHQDFAETATAIASLKTSGYLAPSQLQEMDAKLGLPVRAEA